MANITIPSVLVPKTGTSTSSFWVLIAAWIVGGLFTGLFSMLAAKGYLNEEGSGAIKGWAIEVLSEVLPVAYLAVSGWMTKAYIQARGRIAERKAEAMGQAVQAQMPTADVPTLRTISSTAKE